MTTLCRSLGTSAAAAAIWSLSATASAQEPQAQPAPEPSTTVTTTPPPSTTTTTRTTTPPSTTTTTVTTRSVTVAESTGGPEMTQPEPERDTQFDDSVDLYLVPGVINVPFGGEDRVDYMDRFDPGYEWGLGLGWFERSRNTPLAMSVGGFFSHALLNSEGRSLENLDDFSDQLFRTGLELRPGIVLGERVFLNVPIRGGYSARVRTADVGNDIDLDVDHGGYVGVAGGLDLALVRGFYIGTVAGADFHFYRVGRDHDLYTVTWRARIGYRF